MRVHESRRRFAAVVALVMTMLASLAVGCRWHSSRPERAACFLVEAEAFDELGGWVLDQQFMDLMGSPFLLAHGMGRPVDDAVTEVHFPHAGTWYVFVRTRDWVAPWNAPGAPGRFEVLVDGNPVGATFGTEGEEWHWQSGGAIDVSSTDVRVALHDLTGFEGRCDALVFSDDASWRPPDEATSLASFRRTQLGFDTEPGDGGRFDFVVVGGGMAGSAAAITAARQGLRVALVQDRPVLGGNSSSEVRVWPEGHVNQMPWPAIGDVVMELVPDKHGDSRNAQGSQVFDDDRKLRVARAEPLLTLFLEHRMNGADVEASRIRSIVAQDVRSGRRVRIRGAFFADCTGDGCLGALAGADFEQTDRGHMGASNLWNIQCLCEDEDPLASELAAACDEAKFPRCPWAVDLRDKPFPGRTQGKTVPEAGTQPISLGNWFWENGFDRDPIRDMERIRDQNFRAMYGAWDAIKNVEKRYPAHRLGWVAYIAGKRESRRLLGDVILTGEDLRDGRVFEDGCVPCTWGIDTHHPDPKYAKGHDGDEFIADYTHGEGYVYEGPYWVPYRCLYSRNVDNLFMAGRDISVTHEALGAVRVMKTTGAMGEIVGMAAATCTREACSPREVYTNHLGELQAAMRAGAGRWTVHEEHDRTIELSASSARVRGPSLRYEPDRDCLGYWRTDAAWPEWAIRTTHPAEWRITIELACTDKEAGGPFTVHLEETELCAIVPASGSWDHWRRIDVGTVRLPAGDHRLTVQGGKKRGPLMKLRRVVCTRR
ncbi:MAG: FAD-dependent oxidoreductase [Planctomycetes bacterium]|nr:FAD-dependent oxidoreductase [Planctomycetota bacterium]